MTTLDKATLEKLTTWYQVIFPKLDGPDRHAILHPKILDPKPWLWLGHFQPAADGCAHRARVSAPSWYPTGTEKRVDIQRLVWHLFRGPVPKGLPLRYIGPVTVEPNVNPAHYCRPMQPALTMELQQVHAWQRKQQARAWRCEQQPMVLPPAPRSWLSRIFG
jgi:hypothetical protein